MFVRCEGAPPSGVQDKHQRHSGLNKKTMKNCLIFILIMLGIYFLGGPILSLVWMLLVFQFYLAIFSLIITGILVIFYLLTK